LYFAIDIITIKVTERTIGVNPENQARIQFFSKIGAELLMGISEPDAHCMIPAPAKAYVIERPLPIRKLLYILRPETFFSDKLRYTVLLLLA
jgi:hypothetical protein